MAIMMIIRTQLTAGLFSSLITIFTLVLGSGSLRSYSGLSEWLLYLTYGTQTRYLGSFLNGAYLWNLDAELPFSKEIQCGNKTRPNDADTWLCRFGNGQDFLRERYFRDADYNLQFLQDPDLGLAVSLAFGLGLVLVNSLLYLVPLPGFVKAKFRN